MFYFLVAPYLTYHVLLIAAAAIPAVFLMYRVYKADRLERETPWMMGRMVVAGVLSSLIALLSERLFSWLLGLFLEENTLAYNVILYFGIVAFSEEGAKYAMLRRRSWEAPEFNCQFDGVVYAVLVSLGFALWENISYVMSYGFGTALVRAVTAIPGHACFGVFMGVFYGFARKYMNFGSERLSEICRVLAVLIPALLHGLYDFLATSQQGWVELIFVGFIVVMFIVSYRLVGRMSKEDGYITYR